MKNKLVLALGLIAGLGCAAVAAPTPNGCHSLNVDWKYARTRTAVWPLEKALRAMARNGVSFFDPAFDDSSWQTVSVPHPINALDSFDEIVTGPGENEFYNGFAFYRKKVNLTGVTGRKFFLEVETVRQCIYVWVNGKMVGYYEAGIAPTGFDLTSAVAEGENVIAIACAGGTSSAFVSLKARETRPGLTPGGMKGEKPGSGYQWNTTMFNPVQAGLVGNVSLHVKNTVYLTLPLYNNLKTTGVYVWADGYDFEKRSADVHVTAEIRNESGKESKVGVRATVREAGDGRLVGKTAQSFVRVAAASDAGRAFLTAIEDDVYDENPAPTAVRSPEVSTADSRGRISDLTFWSPDTPHLYNVTVELVDEMGAVLDTVTVRTGFRKIDYTRERGLTFNGKSFWLRGYAQRATDAWAVLGVAPDWLQDFDARLIRESNANFVRWMHVAPKPAPVRSYDKYGVVNVCPAGDAEGEASGRNWLQREEAMRDAMIYFRNSPSVVFWEAGNNQISPAHMRTMRLLKEQVDPHGSRFMGCRTLNTPEQIAEAEYVGTMVHRHDAAAFAAMEKTGRFMPMVETEYCREESPRRFIDTFTAPYDYEGKWIGGGAKKPLRDVWNLDQESMSRALSESADGYTYFYGNRATGSLGRYYSACAMLCWTDCNQHGRNQATENARMSGRVDPVRIPKGNFRAMAAMQADVPTVKILGHWNYLPDTPENYQYEKKAYNGDYFAPTGEIGRRDPRHKTVYVFGSVHCASVELIVNGRSVGTDKKPENVFVFRFPDIDVTASGRVEAIARDADGKVIARDMIESAGDPAKLVLKATTAPKGLLADGADIALVDVSLVDAAGRVCPLATNRVVFAVEGPATFLGGYNSGTFGDSSPIGKDWVNLECGVNRVFLKAGRVPGKIRLTATINGVVGGAVPAPRFEATVELLSNPVNVTNGLMAAALQAETPNGCDFTPSVSAPAVRDLGAAGTGAQPWEVWVNGKKVDFDGAVQPMKPDASTGVVCEFVPVLEAVKSAGAKFKFNYRNKADVPPYLKPFKPPLLTIEAGGRKLEAITGQTQLCLDGKEFVLTNYEMISVGWKLIGELSPLLSSVPGVTVVEDPTTRRCLVTVANR